MRLKTAMLAGSLVLAVTTAGHAQERPVGRTARVTAKLVVQEAAVHGRAGTVVVMDDGMVSVTSEWTIAGRVPVVMAAHVRPASVEDRGDRAVSEARDVGREGWRPVISSSEVAMERGLPVSRHTVWLEAARTGYRVVWYAAVAL